MLTRSIATAALAIAALATTLPVATAHQRVYEPEVIYTVADRGTNWGPQAKLESQGYKTTKDFNAYLKANNYKTLRDFMDKPGVYKPNKGATFECGFTDPNAPAQPIPANSVIRTSGYTHEGPCEIWIDDVMVKHGDNCHFDIGEQKTSDKIDYSACKGKCMLKWYWLGIRPMGSKFSWQIYKACIPLQGGGGGGGSTTPAKTTAAPAATTAAPAAGDSDNDDTAGKDDDYSTPAPTTAKPATTTPAPVTPKPEAPAPTTTPSAAPASGNAPTVAPKKCKTRRSRSRQ